MKSKQKEEWRDIEGYEGYYQVSDLGNVRSLYKEPKVLKTVTRKEQGYVTVCLFLKGKNYCKYVHRLVAGAFLDICLKDSETEVNHKDGDKTNNNVVNLEWLTRVENVQHARDVLGVLHGFQNDKRAKKLDAGKVVEMYRLRNEGKTFQQIADKLEVQQTTAINVLSGKTWREFADREGLKITLPAYRLTGKEVEEVVNLRNQGIELKTIATVMGRSNSCIGKIIRGETWSKYLLSRGIKITYTYRLTKEDIYEAKRLKRLGYSCIQIAHSLGFHATSIYKLFRIPHED